MSALALGIPFCAESDAPEIKRATSNAIVDAAASLAGTLASANEYARSGRSAMPVPRAITPNPNQIQFTSGLR